MTYTDRQVANLTSALIKAQFYIESGRPHHAHEIILAALAIHRNGLASMDQITAFDNSIATIGHAVNYVASTYVVPNPAVNSKPSDPETAA